MEKDNIELSDAASGKHHARGKRRRPKAIGSVAVESKTARRRPATEAQWLHGMLPTPEHIGHTLMSGEVRPAKLGEEALLEAAESTASTVGSADLARLAGQRAETLNRADLMSLSEKVIIDGSSLRQIYETHLIGERGLRRLVAEYLHGGDLRQALRQEVMEREKDFERDPVMRDMTPDPTPSDNDLAPSQKAALDELLKQAELSSSDRSEENAFFKARARYEAQELHQHKQRRRAIDISLAVVILILLLLVIVLSMRRL